MYCHLFNSLVLNKYHATAVLLFLYGMVMCDAGTCPNSDGTQMNMFLDMTENKCTCGNIECSCTQTQTVSISQQISDTTSSSKYKQFKVATLTSDFQFTNVVVKWKDQGWGNKKGRIRVKIIRNGLEIQTMYPAFGAAPHSYTTISTVVEESNANFLNTMAGDTVAFEYTVGGGGGHKLYIQSFSATFGRASCSLLTGMYCSAASNSGHLCTSRPNTLCNVADGSEANTASTDCRCGSATCTVTTGLYCVENRNTCYRSILPAKPEAVSVRIASSTTLELKINPPIDSTITHYHVQRYILQTTERTWQASETACTTLGSTCHLASMHSTEEYEIIKALIDAEPKHTWWFGINDHSNHQTWVYNDGTLVDFTRSFWPEEQKNNENFGSIYSINGNWYDSEATKTRKSICKCTDQINAAEALHTELTVITPSVSFASPIWYCAVKYQSSSDVAVIQKTTSLSEAQQSMMTQGSWSNQQAIIPMSGTKAKDPHSLEKSWTGGSMFWCSWDCITPMQNKCSSTSPPLSNAGTFFDKLHVNSCDDIGCSLKFLSTTQCDSLDCTTATSGDYCVADSITSTCTAQPPPLCTARGGMVLNVVGCSCGSAECTTSSGLYCVAQKHLCSTFPRCTTGMFLQSGNCVSMTTLPPSCPAGKGFSSTTADIFTFAATYEKISDTKCQAADSSDWDMWYKTSSFTAGTCQEWCTAVGTDCVAWGTGLRSDLLHGCIIYVKDGVDASRVASAAPIPGVTCAANCGGTAVNQEVAAKSSDLNWECNRKVLHTLVSAVGATEDDGSCNQCLPGSYKPLSSQFCQVCPRGYTSGSISSSSCTPCAAGYYVAVAGKSQCDACTMGLFSDQTEQISIAVCRTCDAGTIAERPGSSSCTKCPAGTFLKDTTGAIDLHDEQSDCTNCSLAKYNPFPGHSSECFECLSAKLPGTTLCEGCAPGTYKVTVTTDGDLTTDCISCPMGYFTYDRNLDACIKCPEGYHGFDSRPYAFCKACQRGKFGYAEAAVSEDYGCTACFAGRFNENIGLAASAASSSSLPCKGCPRGKYSESIENEKEAACISCGTGMHGSTVLGASSNQSCVHCEPGLYSEAVAAYGRIETCLQCPAGFVQNKPGQAYCLPCSLGKFQLYFGSGECTDCAKGRFSSSASRSELCEECAKGFYQPKAGGTSCLECIPGKYQMEEGATKCSDCDSGKFSNEIALENECDYCMQGYYKNTSGSTSCLSCVPGQHQDLIGQIQCKKCEANTFNNQMSRSSCIQCKKGRSSETGSIECSKCDNGKYKVKTADGGGDATEAGEDSGLGRDKTSYECHTCRSGSVAQAGDLNCRKCEIGLFQQNEGQSICNRCTAGKWSNKTGATSNDTCVSCRAGFYSSALGASNINSCNACAPGKASAELGSKSATSCVECNPGRASVTGSGTCQDCHPGRYQTHSGQTSCMPCIPGNYQALYGESECIKCQPGQYTENIASVSCIKPKEGFVVGQSQADQVRIAVGFKADCAADGLCKMIRCPAGTIEKNHTCHNCKPGESSSEGSTRCENCGPGFFSPFAATPSCIECNAEVGLYSEAPSNRECTECKIGTISTGKSCFPSPIDSTLPTLANIHIKEELALGANTNHTNHTWVRVNWDKFTDNNKPTQVHSLNFEWSTNTEFKKEITFQKKITYTDAKLRSENGNVLLDLGDLVLPLTMAVVYVRVQTVREDNGVGSWSIPNSLWSTAVDCLDSSYLNTTVTSFKHSVDPDYWRCYPCPIGASCKGAITWSGVVALFGYWRVPKITTSNHPNLFIQCPFPGACLGAINQKLTEKYYNESWVDGRWIDGIDYASNHLPEGCNIYYGFRAGSRLCHTCEEGFKRDGLDRCSTCPSKGQNVALLFLAVLLLFGGMMAVVWMTIKDAGKAKQSEIIRKIAFNFLQVSALAADFPLHWPKELEGLFDFQGAISTAGEHMLNPDCSVQGVSAAELFYAKQIGYALIPPGLALLIYCAWRCFSCLHGIPWSDRGIVAHHTYKDKMVVTLCVLLYFFWPTSLKQTFRLFSCRQIGTAEDLFLMSDFEEPCFKGRHLTFVFAVGLTQIFLYAIGLPLVVFMFVRRHRSELDKPVVMFRYGLFFAGFRKESYYWECVVALRKESTVLLGVFGPQLGTPMLAHVALLVFLLQLLVQLIGRKYHFLYLGTV